MKSINDLTQQRNSIQEYLINSGSWKRHDKMYQWVERAWQNYVGNIERYSGKSLLAHGFHSHFANKRYSINIYKQ